MKKKVGWKEDLVSENDQKVKWGEKSPVEKLIEKHKKESKNQEKRSKNAKKLSKFEKWAISQQKDDIEID